MKTGEVSLTMHSTWVIKMEKENTNLPLILHLAQMANTNKEIKERNHNIRL